MPEIPKKDNKTNAVERKIETVVDQLRNVDPRRLTTTIQKEYVDRLRKLNGNLETYGPDRLAESMLGSNAWDWSKYVFLGGKDSPEEGHPERVFSRYAIHQLQLLENLTIAISKSNLLDKQAQIVCCLVNAIYELIKHKREDPQNPEDWQRQVYESDYVAYLRLFRDLLVMIRSFSGDSSFQASLLMLSLDISAAIRQQIDAALMPMMTKVMIYIEWFITSNLNAVTAAIKATRCRPLIDIWSFLVTWAMDTERGFMRRVRGYISNVVVRLERAIGVLFSHTGERLDEKGDKFKYSWKEIDITIQILDLLINNIYIFATCDLPNEAPRDTVDANTPVIDTPITETETPEFERPKPRPITPNDPVRGGQEPPITGWWDENYPPISDPRDPIPDSPSIGGIKPPAGPGTGGGTFPGDTLTPDEKPPRDHYTDKPRVPGIVPETPGNGGGTTPTPGGGNNGGGDGGNPIYLTPENIRVFLITRMSIDPQTAYDITVKQSCREQLSAGTEALLQEIGIL